MSPTICASFEDIASVNQAIGELMRLGMSSHELAVVMKSPPEGTQGPLDQDLGALAAMFPDSRAGVGNPDTTAPDTGFRYAGLAASAGASAAPGVMTDFLWEYLPAEMSAIYRKRVEEGQIILVVRNPLAGAEQILRDCGASLHHRGYLA